MTRPSFFRLSMAGCVALGATLVSGCLLADSASAEILIFDIAPESAECVGEAVQRCLLIRENENEEWELFYDPIEGFTFEEGFRYRVRVERTRIENPVADGSSYSYRLIEVLVREAATPA